MNRVSSVMVEIDGRNVTWNDECRRVAIGVTYEDVNLIAWAWNWVNPGRCPNFIEICIEMSILHVLSPNNTVTEEFINNLTQEEILRLINAGEKEKVLQYLGGVIVDGAASARWAISSNGMPLEPEFALGFIVAAA